MIERNIVPEVEVYASDALALLEEPSNLKTGHYIGETLPAAWWNWLWNRQTKLQNLIAQFAESITEELLNVFAVAGIEPEAANPAQLTEALTQMIEQTVLEKAPEEVALGESEVIEGTKLLCVDVEEAEVGHLIPKATKLQRGTIRVGTGLRIDENGILSIDEEYIKTIR